MRKLVWLFGLLALLVPALAHAQPDIDVLHFDSRIQIRSDGKLDVAETIDVNFASAHHGIYRYIPFRYKDNSGHTRFTEFDVESITRDGRGEEFNESRSGDNVNLKIGDPNTTITGEHKYVITYQVSGILTSFNGYDELYWDVNGNGWATPIEQTTATVALPSNGIIRVACYEGAYGATAKCKGDFKDPIASFSATRPFEPGEGMTVAVDFKPGLVPIVTVVDPASRLLSAPSLAIFGGTLLVGLILIALLWYKKGRDKWWPKPGILGGSQADATKPIGSHEDVIAEYDPPEKLRPAELAVLLTQQADNKAFTATVIDLAVRGFLTITEEPKKWALGSTDYTLAKTAKTPEGLLPYEQRLYAGLFDGRDLVKMSDLKDTFYSDLADVKKQLYQDMVDKKLFLANPNTVRTQYLIFALVIGFGGLAIVFLVGGNGWENYWQASFGAALALVGFVLAFVSFAMPARSAHGRDLYRQAKGYELFVKTVDKYRAPFYERENLFMEVLPYAIVFGVAKKFAKAMKDMGVKTTAPGWYVGPHPFDPVGFGSSMESFAGSMGSAMSSAPGGGGGGFSGGGGGGGGGGGW